MLRTPCRALHIPDFFGNLKLGIAFGMIRSARENHRIPLFNCKTLYATPSIKAAITEILPCEVSNGVCDQFLMNHNSEWRVS